MVNQDIVSYILEGKKRGYEISILKEKLLGGGFSADDVDEAIKEIQDKKLETQESPQVFQQSATQQKDEIIRQRKGFFWRIGKSIANPKELFENTKGESFSRPLVYQLLISILPFVIFGILTFVFSINVVDFVSEFSSFLKTEIGITLPADLGAVVYKLAAVMIGVWAGLFFFVLPLCLIVYAGVLHMFVKLFKGKSSYTSTYKAIVYSHTPMFLLFFVFFLIALFFNSIWVVTTLISVMSIWATVLIVFGLSIYHEFSKIRAFFSILMVGVLISIISLAIIVVGALTLVQPVA